MKPIIDDELPHQRGKTFILPIVISITKSVGQQPALDCVGLCWCCCFRVVFAGFWLLHGMHATCNTQSGRDLRACIMPLPLMVKSITQDYSNNRTPACTLQDTSCKARGSSLPSCFKRCCSVSVKLITSSHLNDVLRLPQCNYAEAVRSAPFHAQSPFSRAAQTCSGRLLLSSEAPACNDFDFRVANVGAGCR